jgi:hypothetical protein
VIAQVSLKTEQPNHSRGSSPAFTNNGKQSTTPKGKKGGDQKRLARDYSDDGSLSRNPGG